jgi:hypothetical protein
MTRSKAGGSAPWAFGLVERGASGGCSRNELGHPSFAQFTFDLARSLVACEVSRAAGSRVSRAALLNLQSRSVSVAI